MAQKRKGKKPRKAKVASLDKKRAEKLLEKAESLTRGIELATDEKVAVIVDHYREWEADNPDAAITNLDKMAMVRLGFVGLAGFRRCHETERLPTDAFISTDGDLDIEVLDDYVGSEALMCPAKEARLCQGVWRAMGLPPCCLLLLEVHAGLGGAAWDERVDAILFDYDKWEPPENFEESFVAAERLLERYRP